MHRRAAMARMLATAAAVSSCARNGRRSEPEPRGGRPIRLVFKHQPSWGDPARFNALLDGFRRTHPDVELISELLPSSADVLHQYYLTSLDGRAGDFDVFVVDVVWVQEFARAGWIADLSPEFPPARIAAEFLPGPAEAVIARGRTFAVPWFVDVGLLFYRTDLVPRAPRTLDELVAFAREARRRDPSIHGYVWQGRQFEGLVCNVCEAIWAHGGDLMRGDRVVVNTEQARAGLGFLRGLIDQGISPQSVTSSAEEETRRVFQGGRAVFMRNWPYAFSEAQAPGSDVRGRVGFSPMPTLDGSPGSGALGGWQLALNAHTPAWKRRAATELIAHLTSAEANVTMAVAYARNPPRRDVYFDPRVRAGAPFIAALPEAVTRARPRPVTAWYNMLSDVLQSEFSAGVAGIRSPAEALRRAQSLIDHITEVTA